MSKPESNKSEFILCAAIKFKDSILCGYRHGDVVDLIKKIQPDYKYINIHETVGFLTSKNRFVTRKEAFKIAQSMNQIWHKLHDGVEENILVSEDLY